MEDVWKDLSLSSLNHHGAETIAAGSISISAAQPELDFQGFLSCPLNLQINRSETSHEQRMSSSGTVPKPHIKTRAASGPCGDENARDRKKIRLMKNRESASRSRARKQAYTYELELEVAHLLEENARLKQQQQQNLCVAAGDQRPKKHKLYRTLTAPF